MGGAAHTAKDIVLNGIHVPCLTWFLDSDTQDIDWDLQTKHVQFLVKSGVDGGEYSNVQERY